MFVPDRQQNTIHVFAPDGRYLTRLGSAGRGPGEFRIIGTLRVSPKHLYVYDNILHRINVFSLDSLAFSHAVRPERISRSAGDESTLIPGDMFFVGRDGRLLMSFRTVLSDDKGEVDGAEMPRRDLYRYYWIDNQGEIVSRRIVEEEGPKSLVEPFHGISMEITLPVYGRSLLTVSPGGTVYSARSDTFLIRQYDAEGNYRRAIYYPFQKSLLRREDLVKHYDHGFDSPHLQAVKKIKLPETWPALQHMLADDRGRLWVATIVDDQTVYGWWVLDMNRDGKLLARFRWPRGRSVEDIQSDWLYACETDTVSGEREIVRYRIFLD